jgi:hypothetical protein
VYKAKAELIYFLPDQYFVQATRYSLVHDLSELSRCTKLAKQSLEKKGRFFNYAS